MTAEAAALSVRGLKVRYGDRTVLSNLDLEVTRGTVFGLLGPNGAGKTTLIRTICGRVRASAGSVAVAGQPSGPRARQHLGLVPQEIALFPHLSARENLAAFARLSGISRAGVGEAIDWAAEATGLVPRLDDRVDVLSGGWKRRANIAAAIMHRPALLILDEPTVGIDPPSRAALSDTIRQLAASGMGILVTTHDLEEAEAMCTLVGFLREGRIDPQGAPRDLIEARFGGQSEIIVRLRATPDDRQAKSLATIGFEVTDSGLTWARMAPRATASAASIQDAFGRAGIKVREIRVRDPGLGSLFAHLSRTRKDEAAA